MQSILSAFASISPLAVLAAAIVDAVVGMTFYSPMVWGEVWMREAKLTWDVIHERGPVKALLIGTAGSLIAATMFAVIIRWSGAVTEWDGALVGLAVWLGLVACMGFRHFIFEGRSRTLFILYAAQTLTSMVLMGVVLTMWL